MTVAFLDSVSVISQVSDNLCRLSIYHVRTKELLYTYTGSILDLISLNQVLTGFNDMEEQTEIIKEAV